MNKSINNAIAKRREALENGEGQKGFTLIELMVVIIIIGILAAIAIPAFLGQRQAAWDASAKSDLSNLSIAAESYSVAKNGSYAGMTVAILTSDYGLKTNAENNVTMAAADVTATAYKATAKNTNSTKTYTNTSGTITG